MKDGQLLSQESQKGVVIVSDLKKKKMEEDSKYLI